MEIVTKVLLRLRGWKVYKLNTKLNNAYIVKDRRGNIKYKKLTFGGKGLVLPVIEVLFG